MGQNISKPRIYLNIPEFYMQTGVIGNYDLWRTLPVRPKELVEFKDFIFNGNSMDFDSERTLIVPQININDQATNQSLIKFHNPYIAFLGNKIKNINIINMDTGDLDTSNSINSDFSKKGFSLLSGTQILSQLTYSHTSEEYSEFVAGSIVMGTYYDFPNSVDLNLKLAYEYDGISETTTIGGTTLTNANWSKPPSWGDLGAFEMQDDSEYSGSNNPKLSRSGRRVWELSFSYIEHDSLFPDRSSIAVNGLFGEDENLYPTLLNKDTFQRVVHFLNGGQIPFLFCSDSTSLTNDKFAIAKFDMNTFEFKQVAFGTYNIKVKIRECW